MKAKVIETGEIVNVTPYPTWYKENGQGPDRREWDEDELEFIYSNKKEENFDLGKELKTLDDTLFDLDGVAVQGATSYLTVNDVKDIAKHFFELGIKAQKGE